MPAPGVPGPFLEVHVQYASPSRRAVGLLAAGTVGLSTAVLGFSGVAQAARGYTVADGVPVPAGICSIQWHVSGGQGGSATDGNGGDLGGDLYVTLPAAQGDVFTLYPGTKGGSADAAAAGAGGTNAHSDTSADGAAGTFDAVAVPGSGGGGGGAASIVTKGGSVYLRAFGGDGEVPAGGTGIGGAGGGGKAHVVNDQAGSSTDQSSAGYYDASYVTHAGDGAITGTGIACMPESVYLNSADGSDGALTLDFVPGEDGDIATAGYQWTKDDGATFAAVPSPVNEHGRMIATITGLTNETAYTIKVRAVGAAGSTPGEWSNQVTGTPYARAAAATDLAVTTAPGKATVTWKAPTDTNPPVARYEVGYGRGMMGNSICSVDAATFTCSTTELRPGLEYSVTVTTLDAQGRFGAQNTVEKVVVPFATTVPKSDGTIESAQVSDSPVAPGKKITLSGTGYAPFSEVVVAIFSEPQVLTTVVTDANGAFTVEVTVPEGLADGEHTLVASGVDALGNVRTLTLPVTVSGGKAALAVTGADIAVPLTIGLVLLGAGAGLLFVSRRRSAV
jgi:hypothetical protein